MRTTPISFATERLQFRLTPERVCIAAGIGSLLIALLLVFWRGQLPFEGLVQRFAEMDGISTSTDNFAEGVRLVSQPALLRAASGLSILKGSAGLTLNVPSSRNRGAARNRLSAH
jgi:hypothetical protein